MAWCAVGVSKSGNLTYSDVSFTNIKGTEFRLEILDKQPLSKNEELRLDMPFVNYVIARGFPPWNEE
jgi:hypothetical protein